MNLEQLRQKKTDLTKQAEEMLDAVAAEGGFTDETKEKFEALKAQIKAVSDLINEAESFKSSIPASETKQIITKAAEAERENLIEAGKAAERARVQRINETVKIMGVSQSFADFHIKAGTDINIFLNLAVDERAKIKDNVPGDLIQTPADDPRQREENDMRRLSMVGALLERFEPCAWIFDERSRQFKFDKARSQDIFDGARSYVGMSLLDVAKECLSNRGIRWQSRPKQEIVQLAFQSTSDFPYILADSANKSLRAGYEMYDSQWKKISARRTVADFKTAYELTLDNSSRLTQVPESGEFSRGALIEGRESYSILTYGKIIAITRQAIINDDLGAFTRVPMLMGQEVAMLEADTVWGIVTANGNLSDSVALFEKSSHKNYDDSAGAISIDTLGALRVLMMQQTGTGGKPLNIVPRYLVVPVGKEQAALQYTTILPAIGDASKVNPWAGRLEAIAEPRLDTADGNDWYLFADPYSPNGTVIVHAYLEGQEGPYTETRNGFDIDGTEIKIRHDFGAGAVDYRGAAKKAGA